ncbi:helix-hairpin-helix domain-containing protein [Bacillus ectoiniformans]|uniref:helix-hairpin-helix domain-containing protein n=1 Tax=Bacillus ectoiniformans TaxID=1494429 RepID=UPI00195CB47A|nr:helix-hairpin-helix domain-containing protein [Bacillus ectoiniformans]
MDVKEYIKKYKTWAATGAAACLFGLYQLSEEDTATDSPIAIEAPAVTETTEEEPAEAEPSQEPAEAEPSQEPAVLMIDVKGAVAVPGIYTLKSGERVNDAIAKAGGFHQEADTKSINLAQKLADEMVIYIPKLGEEPSPIALAPPAMTPAAGSEAASPGGSGESMININTATLDQLQELPGIGESKAQAIIDFRETSGAFTKPEDLKNVSGIGDKTYEKLQPKVSVH